MDSFTILFYVVLVVGVGLIGLHAHLHDKKRDKELKRRKNEK